MNDPKHQPLATEMPPKIMKSKTFTMFCTAFLFAFFVPLIFLLDGSNRNSLKDVNYRVDNVARGLSEKMQSTMNVVFDPYIDPNRQHEENCRYSDSFGDECLMSPEDMQRKGMDMNEIIYLYDQEMKKLKEESRILRIEYQKHLCYLGIDCPKQSHELNDSI